MLNEMQNQRLLCKCANSCDHPNISVLATLLSRMEIECRQRLNITSGYRCQLHNKVVGGAINSSHLEALALDIECSHMSLRYLIIAAALALGVSRIELGKAHVHIDIDPSKMQNIIFYAPGLY